jgi:hypothetical protein
MNQDLLRKTRQVEEFEREREAGGSVQWAEALLLLLCQLTSLSLPRYCDVGYSSSVLCNGLDRTKTTEEAGDIERLQMARGRT